MSVSQRELSALLAELGAANVEDVALAALADLQPEPVCRLCREPLDVRDVDLGTHAGCDPLSLTTGPMPASTIGDLSAALIDYDLSRDRSQQVSVGPSEVGVVCDRRLGYALRNAVRLPDGRVKWAPLLGTAMHALIADALKTANEHAGRARWITEQRVQPDTNLFGSCDAYDTDTDTVIDWKVVGQSTIDKARTRGPGAQYETQIHVYGRGWQRLGYDPRWVRIVFLPRWSHTIDDAYEWTAPYSRRRAEQALTRVRNVDALLSELDVTAHPERWAQVPATPTSEACKWCPYYRPARLAIDTDGCSGYQSKPAQAINDYLASLPQASVTGAVTGNHRENG
jgi:hypothetical protein